MNERIKLLIERAEYQAKKQSGYEDWEVYVEPSREQIFEKFAELIILECARVARNHTLEKYSDMKNSYTGVVFVEESIKKHFGVE